MPAGEVERVRVHSLMPLAAIQPRRSEDGAAYLGVEHDAALAFSCQAEQMALANSRANLG
jgi:hypothetical protein